MWSDGSSPRRVLLLGIDGLADAFLEAPLVVDAIPNLRALLKDSARGRLTSTFPPYTGPAWTTITTGVDPGRHGIFGFTDAAGHPVSDAGVTAARIWDYVGAAGGRSIVVNVPITYPPRPIEGELVCGMPVPPGVSYTAPAALAPFLEERGYIVDLAVAENARESGAKLGRLARMTEARGRAVAWLASSREWDLFAVVFVLPDRLGHPWWKQLVPGDGLYESRAAERIRRRARASLVALDDAIGELLARLPSGTAVVVCSDHGFGPLHADVFFDLVLARAGLMVAPRSPLHRVAARAGRSRAARLAPGMLHRWARERASGSVGDGGLRRAWTAPSYESGVRLADPDDDELRERVTDLLRGLRSPEGAYVAHDVASRAELYHGARTSEAADLLCVMADESVGLHDGLHAPQPWVSRTSVPWGTHATEGVVAISGCGGLRAPLDARAADIAPTVLSLLGLRAEDLDGEPLVPAGDELVVAAARRDARAPDAAYSSDQEAAVLEHLKGLGYVE
jgi:predicted AlkP superfamily phosphohydrolase/phosphomutase